MLAPSSYRRYRQFLANSKRFPDILYVAFSVHYPARFACGPKVDTSAFKLATHRTCLHQVCRLDYCW
uniref:Uncharacterized protein n=1 Tax=Anopheles arabiensis TaxID=7173 RepID=A0A182IHT3_ANOAR